METLHVPLAYVVVAIAILGVSVEHAAADNAVSTPTHFSWSRANLYHQYS
jgi:hypothetical protein